jgi:serine/threonine-protein kinase
MLTRNGVRLLDFCRASLAGRGERPVVDAPPSPTRTTVAAPLTALGAIFGTLPYMSPEQLEGKPTDARTDLWALGTILYEMIAGRRAFDGDSQVSLMAAIVEREPSALSSIPSTPPALDRLVRRCLEKSPDDRWDSAHDAADELRWIAEERVAEEAGRGRIGRALAGLGLFAAGLAAGALAAGALRPRPVSPPQVVRSLLEVGPAEEVTTDGGTRVPGGSRTALDWTPDGRALVFVGRRGELRQIYVRELDGAEARVLQGTEGARLLAVTADGQSVVFWAEGAIRKIPLGGGPVDVVLSGLRLPHRGIACDASGDLYFERADDRLIWRASAAAAPASVTRRLEGEYSHSLPALLPGGKVLLFNASRRSWTWGEEELVAQVLATGERKVLLRDAVDGRYLPSGHLVFLRRGTLMAVGFDPARLEVRGSPVALVDQVAQVLTAGANFEMTGAGQFAVAPTGALAYVVSPIVPYPEATLVSVDRKGRAAPVPAPRRTYAPSLDVSPDGRRVAVIIRDLSVQALWIYEGARGTLNKLTSEGEAYWPRWSPDGRRIAFQWRRDGQWLLAWQSGDGTAPPELLALDSAGAPSSWSPDGTQLALQKDRDIWVATIDGSRSSIRQVTRTPYEERWPEFSRDGKWLAYGANASGRYEVYLQAWPESAWREQVSVDGGETPAWSRDGRELFFLTLPDTEGRRRMMVVDVHTEAGLNLSTPRPLFVVPPRDTQFACWPSRCYGVSADGRQFYIAQLAQAPPPPSSTIGCRS